MTDRFDFSALEERLGRAHLRQRLDIQLYHSSRVLGQGLNYFHFENLTWLHTLIHLVLRLCGLYARGKRNACAIELVQNHVGLKNLPAEFQGFRILQISDLHLDMDSELANALYESVTGLEYDLCILTGDFRAATHGDYLKAVKGAEMLIPRLNSPIFGILGNHDFIEQLPYLEAMGVKMLMNESATIQRGSAKLTLTGIDDPHFYLADNLQKAAEHLDDGDVTVLLSHSPEAYRKAASFGFDLMLSGHTHGGQICLPGGIPIITNGNCPRRMVKGPWTYRSLKGYTSKGAGCSGVPVRFFCRPDVTIHTLLSERPE